jgi:uncharacterized lipoprotein YddW (UPF0748 family)
LYHGAYWYSTNVPWCGYTTTNFDPLGYVCQKAHANGIEVHAWLGGSGGCMYRVTDQSWPPAGNDKLKAHPEWMMVPYTNSEGGSVVGFLDGTHTYYLLDMGSPDVQEYIVNIVRELVARYPIDGINWDDEFDGVEYNPIGIGYPAKSTTIYTNSGLARYRAMTGSTTTPSPTNSIYGDYRRRFHNELIARCQAEIQSIKTNPRQPLRHTVTGMAYGYPPSTCDFTSTSAYTYYADWAGMLQNGWVDAALPMVYSDDTFYSWADRCASCWCYNRHIFMDLGAYKHSNFTNVFELQYAYNKGLKGCATYSYAVANYSSTPGDWWTYVAANLYTNTATTPPMPWRNPATATEGIMWGRVKDAKTGLYVDDATVTVTGGPTVKTDGNGYYVATLIPATAAGTRYSTTASKSGKAPQTIPNATVLAGDIVRYDFMLNMPSLCVFPTKTNTVVVSWASPTPTWSILQSTNLSTNNWVSPGETVNDNGTTRYIIVQPSSSNRFYRLSGY